MMRTGILELYQRTDRFHAAVQSWIAGLHEANLNDSILFASERETGPFLSTCVSLLLQWSRLQPLFPEQFAFLTQALYRLCVSDCVNCKIDSPVSHHILVARFRFHTYRPWFVSAQHSLCHLGLISMEHRLRSLEQQQQHRPDGSTSRAIAPLHSLWPDRVRQTLVSSASYLAFPSSNALSALDRLLVSVNTDRWLTHPDLRIMYSAWFQSRRPLSAFCKAEYDSISTCAQALVSRSHPFSSVLASCVLHEFVNSPLLLSLVGPFHQRPQQSRYPVHEQDHEHEQAHPLQLLSIGMAYLLALFTVGPRAAALVKKWGARCILRSRQCIRSALRSSAPDPFQCLSPPPHSVVASQRPETGARLQWFFPLDVLVIILDSDEFGFLDDRFLAFSTFLAAPLSRLPWPECAMQIETRVVLVASRLRALRVSLVDSRNALSQHLLHQPRHFRPLSEADARISECNTRFQFLERWAAFTNASFLSCSNPPPHTFSVAPAVKPLRINTASAMLVLGTIIAVHR
eukprot:ANDGO_03110.mRNA.1 hypothetical protein